MTTAAAQSFKVGDWVIIKPYWLQRLASSWSYKPKTIAFWSKPLQIVGFAGNGGDAKFEYGPECAGESQGTFYLELTHIEKAPTASVVTPPTEEPVCVCSGRDLFMYGCRC